VLQAEPSPIAGIGLFTAQPIPAGTTVLTCAPVDFGGLNHSCDPNLGWADDATLTAVRDIAAGEELTVDYATAITDPAFVLYCHCGTYRCRQVIEGTDWQIPQLQTRYAGRWAPRVQRRIDAAAR
jgi:hypothetical protein